MIPPKCSCDDDFTITPCVVHGLMGKRPDVSPQAASEAVVRLNDLLSCQKYHEAAALQANKDYKTMSKGEDDPKFYDAYLRLAEMHDKFAATLREVIAATCGYITPEVRRANPTRKEIDMKCKFRGDVICMTNHETCDECYVNPDKKEFNRSPQPVAGEASNSGELLKFTITCTNKLCGNKHEWKAENFADASDKLVDARWTYDLVFKGYICPKCRV